MSNDSYNSDVYQHMSEQLGFPHQTSGHRPMQNLPRRDILADAEARKIAAEREASARNLRGNILPPEAYPQVRKHSQQEQTKMYSQGDDELYDDADLSTRPPRSAVRRYQPEEEQEVYNDGNTSIYRGELYIPKKRRSAKPQLPPAPAYQREQYTEGIREQSPERESYRRRVHVHWFVPLGIGMIVALILWLSGALVINWWKNTQNDWTYTQAFRTFSIDEVVGHNHDSEAHPSHFIVQNDKRHIIIIELPADDFTKAIIYSAPRLIGEGQDRTPVTISFQLNGQTGRVDMILHVQATSYTFTNNGTKFVVPQGQ